MPKEIPGTGAIVFGYGAIDGKRDWGLLLESVSVLVKKKNAIVVMKKLKARTALDKPIYEGLIAAKTRLSKEEIEKARSKPVLASNVIFEEDADTSGISDRLLNGCMWPIDDKTAVGIKDVGLASQLRPEPKYGKEKTEEDANSVK